MKITIKLSETNNALLNRVLKEEKVDASEFANNAFLDKFLPVSEKLGIEAGFILQEHLHFCFIPVEEDPKHEQGYKICANDVLDRRELRNFHPDLQRYLDEHGLEDAHVMTGVTKRQGGNRTVAQLKVEREQEYQQEVERPALYFGESKIEQGLHF